MNRDKALAITDLIFAVVADDPKNFNRDKITDLIQAGDALPEIVDIISHDDEKWVHRDGTAFDVNADQVPADPPDGGEWIPAKMGTQGKYYYEVTFPADVRDWYRIRGAT